MMSEKWLSNFCFLVTILLCDDFLLLLPGLCKSVCCIIPFLLYLSDERLEFSLHYDARESEGEENKGEAGPPGGYL